MDVPRFQPVRSEDYGGLQSNFLRSKFEESNDPNAGRGALMAQRGVQRWALENGFPYPVMPKQIPHNRLRRTTAMNSGPSKGAHENDRSLISHANTSQISSLAASCGSSDVTESSVSLSNAGQYSVQQTYPDLMVTRGHRPYGEALPNMDQINPAYSATTWHHDAVQAVIDPRPYHVPHPEEHVFHNAQESTQRPPTTESTMWPLIDTRTTNGEQLQRCSSHQNYPEQYLATTVPFVSSVSTCDSLVSYRTHSKLLPASSLSRRSSVTQPDDVSVGTSTLASQEYLPFSEYSLDEGLAAPGSAFHPLDLSL